MKLTRLLILSSVLLRTTVSLDNRANDESEVGLEKSSDLEISNLDMSSGKGAASIGVKEIEDDDNNPTPANAKKPLDPPVQADQESTGEDNPSYNSFLMSISMIIVSEIGDKTFLIAALMAMRNSRFIVFSAAFSSLAVMTVLSGIVGHALPALISQRLTQFLASILFIVFGFKLLKEGLEMSKELGVEEELAEVEEEIASNNLNNEMENIEGGSSYKFTAKSQNKTWYIEFGDQMKNLASFVLSPVWIQVFVMTFLGEWGDRSQIATIAMAAGSDYWYVILGAIIGHGICTAAACVGGKLLATRISMRNVTLGGAIAFFVFAILYLYDALYNTEA
mmetsp:Transcript_3721/g.3619  ORF Transcript_3721/g.3619 Transcript_3721/m.3619 type:complete len:336 (+) Transcript_3721:115-1122(+)